MYDIRNLVATRFSVEDHWSILLQNAKRILFYYNTYSKSFQTNFVLDIFIKKHDHVDVTNMQNTVLYTKTWPIKSNSYIV